MVEVVFFEKPGCINNTKQKKLLSAAGCKVVAQDLLGHLWSKGELELYFQDLPVEQWFNKSAPRLKSGEVSLENLDHHAAMELLLNDHLLIRRPLIEVKGKHLVGFDIDELHKLIGKHIFETEEDIESCPKQDDFSECRVKSVER